MTAPPPSTPTADAPDPKSRFTDRVDLYVKYRPSYPPATLEFLRREDFLRDGMTVADVGSGTGISSAMFLRAGCRVIGVEPNAAMRAAAEQALAANHAFSSIAGSAEASTLPAASVDLVVAGQAFHWFDRAAFAAECRRILRPGGGGALFWNSRKLTGSPFAERYEALLMEHGVDYARVRHDAIREPDLAAFFAPCLMTSEKIPSCQRFDYAGLEGRLLSSSYTPTEHDPRRAAMVGALRRLFDDCQQDGYVQMEYWTEIHAGRMG